MSFLLRVIVAFCVLVGACPTPSPIFRAASKSPVHAKHGMVASAEKRASQIGIDMLKKGGNAVDAAVAVGFALAVTHPTAGNLGGGGFMMIRFAGGETVCIDYRETAPAAAGREVYVDSSGQVVPKASTEGYRASGVPGTPAGLCLAQKKYGRLSLKEVMQPAIDLAEKGFPVSEHLSESLRKAADLLGLFPESRRVYLNEGKYFEPGEWLLQKDLASSLRAVRDQGAEAFYRGLVARRIASVYAEHGGWITQQDLASYEPRFRTPLRGSYRGYEVITMPPPSSGGTVLLEMLNGLEGYDLSSMGAGSSRTIHLVTEVMRRAFRDRAELMGDTDFVKVPVSQLISKSYALEIRKQIDPDKASVSLSLPARVLPAPEATETTHFSVVDKDGNAVANTYTLNGGYGAGVTLEGTGILMNNEMDDFTSKPGVPNAYGLIQGEANAIVPGKRPLSAMTPTFLTREGKLFLVIGSPGGPTIMNTVLQVILNLVDFGFTIQEAIDAPRFHHQWLPDELRLEQPGFSEDVTKALEARGHRLVFRSFMGDAEGILVEPKTGALLGASDPRGDGLTVGY
ncbi:MAG: gamma-glutamyltransferase [Acidobacteria bacterium]|nr:gamma-glutamyltransferase [Acidobacteriota bacterium]MCI0720609.1 gamma-glutamyltransferase [Acidobacteriota bacterium]